MKEKLLAIVLLFLIIGIFFRTTISEETSNFGVGDAPKVFSLDDPKTWYLDWNKIKQELKADSDKVNALWSKASLQNRQKAMENLIGQKYRIKLVNFGSSELKFNNIDNKIVLTNGRTYLDPENLPPSLQELSYDDKEDSFIYKFKEFFEKDGKRLQKTITLAMKDGTLDYKDGYLIIKGTNWPSDGLKWNIAGKFTQAAEGIKLQGDAKITLGRMEITAAEKDKEGFAIFLPGDNGNNYVRGKNLDVLIKDENGNKFARAITPVDKITEVFVDKLGKGPILKDNQYVAFNENGESIKIVGEDITTEVFKSLKKIEVSGERNFVKNSGNLYEFKNAQTYANEAAKKGNKIDIVQNGNNVRYGDIKVLDNALISKNARVLISRETRKIVPSEQIEFKYLRPTRKSNTGIKTLDDIMSHESPGDSNPYPELTTRAHETTHGINSYIRNKIAGDGNKYGGFYIGDGKYIILKEPNILMRDINSYLPSDFKIGKYDLYIRQNIEKVSGANFANHWDEPLYILNEATAYTNGAEVGIEMAKTRRWTGSGQDLVSGPMEFIPYNLALGMAVQQKDIGYWNSPEGSRFRGFLRFQLERQMKVFDEGKDISYFKNFQTQYNVQNNLRNSRGAENMRQFSRDTFGSDWTQRVLGF
ncbi:MAG: hypothetical protein AABW90_01210 [Nanoarchaeota archaeon]